MLIFDLLEAKSAEKTVVIIPGGFHPFHPGHLSLYQSAQKMFPGADIYYAATNDKTDRPFDIADKARLAQIAGVPAGHFVQVRSPFGAEEITSRYDPETTRLVYAKSEKNSPKGPEPEGPFPAEPDPKTGQLPLVTRGPRKGLPVSDRLQYYRKGQPMAPMSRHGYMAYLPTVEFPAGASGVTSATQIRTMWPKATPDQRAEIVADLYPNDPESAQQILDKYIGEDANTPVAVDSTSPVGGVAEAHMIKPELIDLFYRPVQNSRGRRVVAQDIPYSTLDVLLKKLSDKFNVPVESFEWVPVNTAESAEVDETIRKVKGGYRLVSHKGKNLGTYPSRAGAEKRERQVQYFKHQG